jgi:predicted DNA-binding protein with PD1-like motif
MRVERKDIKNLVFMRFNPGDDLLAAIKEGVEKNGIRNAVILSGVGSVISHSYHVVASSVNPPKNEFIKGDRPADIVNIDGFVINGRVHAHIIFSDTNIAYGGHLESGAEVLTFALITLAEVDANFDKYDSVGKIEDLLS